MAVTAWNHGRGAENPAYRKGYWAGYKGKRNKFTDEPPRARDEYWLGWMHGTEDGRVDRNEE